ASKFLDVVQVRPSVRWNALNSWGVIRHSWREYYCFSTEVQHVFAENRFGAKILGHLRKDNRHLMQVHHPANIFTHDRKRRATRTSTRCDLMSSDKAIDQHVRHGAEPQLKNHAAERFE